MSDNIRNRQGGYQRAARIVFLTGRPDGLAGEAALFCEELGGAWMQARAAALPGCISSVAQLTVDDLAWGDLLVTLDAAALAGLPARRSAMQHRHYPFEPGTKDNMPEVIARLRERIAGMAGGLRMLHQAAQMDEEPGVGSVN